MPFGFMIANLLSNGSNFKVQTRFGVWEFQKASWYNKIIPDINKGMIGNTFTAFNDAVTPSISNTDFHTACVDLRDLCLLLSFQGANCVTPSGSVPTSFAHTVRMGDSFVPPRAILGFRTLSPATTTTTFLSKAFTAFGGPNQKYIRLLLFYWISSLTCYRLEDLFLAVCVQFDIVKQSEIAITGKKLTYLQGMKSASTRLGISPLSNDFKDMRNDLVHEGQLSGSNFLGRSKEDCSKVVADALNWLDKYIIAIVAVNGELVGQPRWNAANFEHFLPAFSL